MIQTRLFRRGAPARPEARVGGIDVGAALARGAIACVVPGWAFLLAITGG